MLVTLLRFNRAIPYQIDSIIQTMDFLAGLLFFITCVICLLSYQANAIQEKEILTFINATVSWNEASQYCAENDMTLLSIESSAKQYFVEKYIVQWSTYVTGPIWMGLHETNVSNPLQVEWFADCTGDLPFENFVTGTPSSTPDKKYCFGLDVSTTKWISLRCDVKLQFICQQRIGPCTFALTPKYGCNHSVKQTSEVGLDECLDECRQSTLSDGQQCWGIGHWPGYNSDDCWKFFSFDPEICIKKKVYYSLITLGVKSCFTSATNNPFIYTTNSSIYPQSPCFSSTDTGIQKTDQTTAPQTGLSTGVQVTTEKTPVVTALETGLSTGLHITTQETTVMSKPSTTAPQTELSTGVQITKEETTVVTAPETGLSTGPQITTQETTVMSKYATTVPGTTPNETTNLVLSETTTVTHQNGSSCYCACSNNITIHGIDYEEFKNLLATLVVNRKSTSKYKRGLTSAEDHRTSAKAIGYVGVIFLVFTFGTIVVLDLPLLILSVKKASILFQKRM